MTPQIKEQISQLIQRFAAKAATEDLLIFMAETGGMLEAGQQFLGQVMAKDPTVMAWLRAQCEAAKVREAHFLAEMRTILAVLHPGREGEDLFAVLELAPGADNNAIKQSYRRLCRRYHPDTCDCSPRNTEAFIRLTHAYHTLMHSGSRSRQAQPAVLPPEICPWRQQDTRTSRDKRRISQKRQCRGMVVLSILLIVVSLVAARAYNDHIMLARLQNKGLAFVPPGQGADPGKAETVAPPVEPPPTIPSGPTQGGSITSTTLLEESPPKAEEMAHVNHPAGQPASRVEDSPAQLPAASKASVSLSTVPVKPLLIEQHGVPEKPVRQQGKIPAVTAMAAIAKMPPTHHAVFHPPSRPPVPPSTGHSHRHVGAGETAKTTAKSIETAAAAPPTMPVDLPRENPAFPASPPHPRVPPEPSTQQRIDRFFRQYIAAYQARNLSVFSRFFVAGATENGRSFKEILPAYADLFAAATSLQFSVSPAHWETKQGRLHVEGRFRVVMHFRDGSQRQGEGPIDFQLTDASSPQVRSLRYSFVQ